MEKGGLHIASATVSLRFLKIPMLSSRDSNSSVNDIYRRVWNIGGQVQGVGFRPFVHRLAVRLGLTGTVHNNPAGVTIEAFGSSDRLDEFKRCLTTEAPQLAQIDRIECVDDKRVTEWPGEFQIVASSRTQSERGRVTVDSGVCADCLQELFDKSDRRFRHGLINCTNCGPRYTIVRDLPYDRQRTTMVDFAMCNLCSQEYSAPSDRRFHAQPTCCHDCGPRVTLTDKSGGSCDGDPFEAGAALLRDGKILAMKGLGGYHLVVRADSEDAVARLRQLKHRDYKPFAVMVRDLEQARGLVSLSDEAESLLRSPISPIVLAERKDAMDSYEDRPSPASSPPIAPSIAPRCHRLGIMLPHTPMQHLLMTEPVLDGVPLVMTSANLSDDPLIKDDEEAKKRLNEMCDAFLWHDRPIERAVDDSVVADTSLRRCQARTQLSEKDESPENGTSLAVSKIVPIRRARGYVPTPLPLPLAVDEPGICAGGELKNAVAVVQGHSAVLSEHVGDLSYTLAYQRFQRTLDDLQRLFEITPAWIATDRHPQYVSRRYGKRLSEQLGIAWYEVQHHHAHLASLAAEHGRTDAIIGLICDGVGFGDDGTAWGGEVLVGDAAEYRRLGRLRPLRLPGGDAAARQTGRCGASWLFDLFGQDAKHNALSQRLLPKPDQRDMIFSMLQQDLACPVSSGLGRLFDAAAAVLGICDFNHYEAMSGQLLESAACRAASGVRIRSHEPVLTGNGLVEFDTRPVLADLFNGLERGEPAEDLAWFFHDAVASGFAAMAQRVSEQTDIRTVGLSGGVFCNGLLTALMVERLECYGLEVLVHKRVPPNDGGLAYGQAAVVAARRQRPNNERQSF